MVKNIFLISNKLLLAQRSEYLLTQIKTNLSSSMKMHRKNKAMALAREHHFKYFLISLFNSFQQDPISHPFQDSLFLLVFRMDPNHLYKWILLFASSYSGHLCKKNHFFPGNLMFFVLLQMAVNSMIFVLVFHILLVLFFFQK